MLFGGDAVVFDLQACPSNVNKTKPLSVRGRNFHSLSFRLRGDVLFETDGHSHCSRKNGITFMPAGFSYKTEVPEEGRMLLIQFQTAKQYPHLQPAFWEAGDGEIESLFAQICDSYTADGTHNYRCLSLMYALLEALDNPRLPIPKRMRTAKARMDKDFSEPLSIRALACEAGMSEVYFRNEFKKYYSMSPIVYLKRVRIENAKLLLRSGYRSVTEVALDCGFDSSSYFSAEFKRLTGMTPTQYIQKSTVF